LITRITVFVLFVKIKPKLESVSRLGEAHRNLRMYDAFSSGHPLNVSRSNDSFVSFEVLMRNLSRKHIGDCLKATVRVVREPCRKSDPE
jgi:hypothetical protein